MGPGVTPGKVYVWSNFQKFASNKIRFLKILKINELFFIKSAKFFLSVLQSLQRDHTFTIKIKDRREAPWKPIVYIYFACLFVCIPKGSKQLNRSGLNILSDLAWLQGRFVDSRRFFIKSRNFCLFLFYNVHKENMFTMKIEDLKAIVRYKAKGLRCESGMYSFKWGVN